jgi:hypothetical protein
MYACPSAVGAWIIASTLLSNTLAFAETCSRVVELAEVIPTLVRSVEISTGCVCRLVTDALGCMDELSTVNREFKP